MKRAAEAPTGGITTDDDHPYNATASMAAIIFDLSDLDKDSSFTLAANLVSAMLFRNDIQESERLDTTVANMVCSFMRKLDTLFEPLNPMHASVCVEVVVTCLSEVHGRLVNGNTSRPDKAFLDHLVKKWIRMRCCKCFMQCLKRGEAGKAIRLQRLGQTWL